MSAISGKKIWIAIAIGTIGCTPWLKWLTGKLENTRKLKTVMDALSVLLCAAILAVSGIMLAGGTYNPFIYFRF